MRSSTLGKGTMLLVGRSTKCCTIIVIIVSTRSWIRVRLEFHNYTSTDNYICLQSTTTDSLRVCSVDISNKLFGFLFFFWRWFSISWTSLHILSFHEYSFESFLESWEFFCLLYFCFIFFLEYVVMASVLYKAFNVYILYSL